VRGKRSYKSLVYAAGVAIVTRFETLGNESEGSIYDRLSNLIFVYIALSR
jgi:hypothetical protein